MMIIELDGSQHAEPLQQANDVVRAAYLEQLGYLVLRVWNAEINRNIDGLLTTILTTASARRKSPSSALRAPSPQGEKATTSTVE